MCEEIQKYVIAGRERLFLKVIEFLSIFIHIEYDEEKEISQEKMYICFIISDLCTVRTAVSSKLED